MVFATRRRWWWWVGRWVGRSFWGQPANLPFDKYHPFLQNWQPTFAGTLCIWFNWQPERTTTWQLSGRRCRNAPIPLRPAEQTRQSRGFFEKSSGKWVEYQLPKPSFEEIGVSKRVPAPFSFGTISRRVRDSFDFCEIQAKFWRFRLTNAESASAREIWQHCVEICKQKNWCKILRIIRRFWNDSMM